jgi:hypothetical protein
MSGLPHSSQNLSGKFQSRATPSKEPLGRKVDYGELCHSRSGKGVGDPLWSARVPLDPPVANEFNSMQTKQADEGVGCRPGGLPHNEGKLGRYREN